MKEYIAETGGRFTYTDDLLNLQELALSMTSIFSGCSNFIISGCEIEGSEVSEGYVWLNNKVRYYEGCKNAVFPYYIYEKNTIDTTSYAEEVNKRGRFNYLCSGGISIPTVQDALTNALPEFIELKPEYSPRFIDKFIGKYALLVNSPFSKQTIKKDIVLAGKFTSEKEIDSKTAISVVNESTGSTLKNSIKAGGEGSVGIYSNGLPVNEIVLHTNGSFSFIRQNQELAKITEEGIACKNSTASSTQSGSILLFDSSIINSEDATDDGAVNINISGFKKGGTKFRNLNVYNGKSSSIPLFQVLGKTDTTQVNGLFNVSTTGKGFTITNKNYPKTDTKLINAINWVDNKGETIGFVGYTTHETFDFTVTNLLGNVTLQTNGYFDIIGDLKVNGIDISSTYVSKSTFTTELTKKVTAIEGKQLSTEDFTILHKEKLEGIKSSSLNSGGEGYVSAKDVAEGLSKKLSVSNNLSDISDKSAARANLSVFSKEESNATYLKVTHNLLELVTLTADEVNGMNTEQIAARKLEKQSAVRDTIDAEKKGTGDLKLTKTSNLSDLSDKIQARKNISVYSTTEIDKLLEGKLSSESAYSGAVFTNEHKTKLESIKTGNFTGTNNEGVSISQVEGYLLTSHVVKELSKKANLLLDGYTENQKNSIASNINVYTKNDADAKFGAVESLFQDYINYLVKQGKTTADAQKFLRDKLNIIGKDDIGNNYLRKDLKLTDLTLPNTEAKKLACNAIGAAYAGEYQAKLIDTGWLQMQNYSSKTDTSQLFVRQIGNIVCIQGFVYIYKVDGSYSGGILAVIPNQISPPHHSVKTSMSNYYQLFGTQHISVVVQKDSGYLKLYASGYSASSTEINFTYMT